MIEQKATVASRSGEQVWVEAERQSTCGQCKARKGCGTGLLSKHVGKKFSRIAVKDDGELRVGQQVTVSIPEEALLTGAFMMYMLPLILLFTIAITVRLMGGGELLQIVSGLLGLITGFVWVKHRMSHHDAGINVKPNEDFK
ncbi:SoxR reducing system RseC family protein [Methylophaga sp.]|uniref:SoxR reducing system RseC family protein n=1 Tax=Methylophaga sp. TaxID=2024840 RepID=UPI003A8CA457